VINKVELATNKKQGAFLWAVQASLVDHESFWDVSSPPTRVFPRHCPPSHRLQVQQGPRNTEHEPPLRFQFF
jgi:hypothetical protein